MPPDATVDDAIERLVFLAKIEAGLNELDAGKGIPHEEPSVVLVCGANYLVRSARGTAPCRPVLSDFDPRHD